MKVVLINHSDTRGGAAVVTVRLLNALCRLGIDARMLVMVKESPTESPRIDLVGNALTRRAAFLYEHLDIFLHNGFNRADLFKASIAVCGMPLHRHPWVKDADVVMLAWVNQGMLSLKEISRIQAPVVWVMHDMWNLTGVCHYAGDCTRFRSGCGHCPILYHGRCARDLSTSTYRRKQRLYAKKKIHFVAVSNWLNDCCAESPLMRDQKVSVIPNVFPIEDFHLEPQRPRSAYGFPEGKKIIVLGAARLDVPIKGLPLAIEALNKVADIDAVAVFYGALRDEKAFDGLRMPHLHLGTITDYDTLRDIYAHADCVLSTAHYENLPGTLIEGMAAGCVPVTFGRGGQRDIVDHLSTGYIAEYPDTDDVARGIRFALSGEISPRLLRDTVASRFSADNVAARYIKLFNNLT